jgi:hypothetical protein
MKMNKARRVCEARHYFPPEHHLCTIA